MKYIYRSRVKTKRLFVIIGAFLCYLLLILVDGWSTFPQGINTASPFLWMWFGSSVLIALLFLTIGSLVWRYARNRFIALLLFCFSFTMMVTFVVETGATVDDPLLSALGSVSSQFALFLLSALLLLFPRNYLAWPPSKEMPTSKASNGQRIYDRRHYLTLLLRGYITILFLLSLFAASTNAIFEIPSTSSWQLLNWLNSFVNFYDVIVLVGILLTIVISYRQSFSLRERQQIRLLVTGIILALAPVLVLTILPLALNWPAKYVIDPRITTLSLILLPLALGYAILRYQILVFDTYIRRTIASMVGVVSLALLIYLTVALSSVLILEGLTRIIFVTIVMALLAPLIWHLAHLMIDRLFFSENLHYRKLIARFDKLGSETINLDEAAQLLTQAAINAFETPEACLFVLEEESGHYHLYPSLPCEASKLSEGDRSRLELVRYVVRAIDPLVNEKAPLDCNWIGINAPLIERLSQTSRPLLLSEVTRDRDEMPLGFARYLRSTAPLGADPLLVPVRIQGKMIGVLVLGHRGDQQQYAGPDFEVIEFILTRFASILETARLYAQTNRHIALLDTLYGASSMSRKEFSSVEAAAKAYAEVAAAATDAAARVWLYDEKQQVLTRTSSAGFGPFLILENTLRPTHQGDWISSFSQGSDLRSLQAPAWHIPPCLTGILETPLCPFAWLPLNRGPQHLGVLVLTYPGTHIFSPQERRVLEMFASQCAAALESTRMNIELRAAYERQKELDQLKDQFIITASHELRTPLTAVMGYLELLGEYAPVLPPERLNDFIAKALRGCNELTLMVSNIMDASRVQVDAGKITLSTVSLAESVNHVLEILEAMTRREQRTMQVDIPQYLSVEADDLRLRQVLLNLVNNALKYSPGGTSVEIAARVDEASNLVTISVNDHGLGVPAIERDRLFDRFMRLERDMNSPVRGAGLGLYICKQLVEAMGGHIWVESSGIADQGSTFFFTLRRAGPQIRADCDSPSASLAL
jgi:signal transduction histidine kinase